MVVTTQKYQIGQRAQLIDLNSDLTNFKLSFDCISVPPSADFQLYVATQTELDKTEIQQLPFKIAKGHMNGTIIADEDKYDNFFLVVQSQQDIELEVRVDITPIEPKSKAIDVEPQPRAVSQTSFLSSGYWTPSNIFFWVIFTVIIIFLIYYLFIRKTHDSLTEPQRVKTSVTTKPTHSVIDDINDL